MSVSIVLFPVKYVIVNLIWTVPFGNLKVIQRKICFFFKKELCEQATAPPTAPEDPCST